MPLLNFKPEWANAVELGAMHANGERIMRVADDNLVLPKRTTIRKPGRAKPGDTLYLYTGLRTKRCQKLGEVLCLFVTPIFVWRTQDGIPMVELSGRLLDDEQIDRLARIDTAGLWRMPQLVNFFGKHYGLPFHGELIGW